MGWYCCFSLTVTPEDPQILQELQGFHPEVHKIIDEEGNCAQETTVIFPDIVESFSVRYPDTLFTVYITGWSGDELEVAYIKNGEMQYEEAAFPPFDPEKLR